MTILSTNSIAGGLAQPGGFVTSQPIPSLQIASPKVDLPKIEPKITQDAAPDLLQHAVDEANKVFAQIHSDVQFVVDETSKKVVVKLVEPSTGEVLNQYPTEHAIAISNAIAQMQQQSAERYTASKSSSAALLGLFVKQKS
jgi:flagellar protein FlaG